MALRIAPKLSIGSPIPIKTILSNFSHSSSRYKNCSTISLAVRFLEKPNVPVLQNAHPIAHPTWQETQAVFLPFPSKSKTVSTQEPSCKVNCNFTVPSGSTNFCVTEEERRTAFCESSFLICSGRFVISSKDFAPSAIHLKICFALNFCFKSKTSVNSEQFNPAIAINESEFCINRPFYMITYRMDEQYFEYFEFFQAFR